MKNILNSLSDPRLVELLKAGAVGVLPTDTVYGLAAAANQSAAVARMYSLKNRTQDPGTVIAASVEQLVELGLKARYLKPVEHYWPASLSVIIPSHDLEHIHLGKGGIAVRIPAHPELNKLLQVTGPLVTTSANHPGQPPAVDVQEAVNYFDDLVDFYVDGGDLTDHKPSTLIRIVDDAVEILRPGAVNINEAGEVIE
jgi:tRNA threonylcarbamoyl adenosine modification protein (Sua5/YciO/YrdC/YwlC family)